MCTHLATIERCWRGALQRRLGDATGGMGVSENPPHRKPGFREELSSRKSDEQTCRHHTPPCEKLLCSHRSPSTHISTQDKARFPRTLYTGKLFVRLCIAPVRSL